jgi:hypothetical protein
MAVVESSSLNTSKRNCPGLNQSTIAFGPSCDGRPREALNADRKRSIENEMFELENHLHH